jgi:hypothetical protein
MRRRALLLALASLCAVLLAEQPRSVPTPDRTAPDHGRPFFMPPRERQRIRDLIRNEAWARQEHARLEAAAKKGDGYAAAFLYALDGEAKYVRAARDWLVGMYGPDSYWIKVWKGRLASPDFFKAGQTGIPEVYYNMNITGLLGYDWAYKGLAPADRKVIEEGMLIQARHTMRCMDRWTQTPNLVFKPTYLVAMTGLTLRNKECLEWGFHRRKPWGPHIGGYFEVLDSMQKDGGPCHEASIYPVVPTASSPLGIANICRHGNLANGRDWWNYRVSRGGTPKGLMDYSIDSAYPLERTGHGAGQVRVATYGDGATGPGGDLFLVNPAGPGLNMEETLIAAYNASADPRYAAFLSLVPGYKPDFVDRRPLPAKVTVPPAPSRVWPEFGLAMLRSDESAGYWTNPRALAVFQVMTRGYGHDHRHKFCIMLHGANRLFYPDCNAVQYENMAFGWTRNSVCKNTLVVDEQDTRDAAPTGIRHDFTPEVKFLATSADAVYQGVEQARALVLTGDYLLDLFSAHSAVPHTYDYLLHSFGKVEPARPAAFRPSTALRKRYWPIDALKSTTTDDPWSLDLVIKEQPPAKTPGGAKAHYGKAWYDHTARLRLTMAGEPGTLVAHGVWGEDLARRVAGRYKGTPGARLDRLSMLAVRRKARDTVFISTHEPHANAERPRIRSVTRLARSGEAVVVRVEAGDFTDYAAVAFGPQKDKAEHVLAWSGKPGGAVAFKDYGYLRVTTAGKVSARGGWTGWRLPGIKGPATLNGRPAKVEAREGALVLGTIGPAAPAPVKEPECPLSVTIEPAVVRLFDRDRRRMTFTIKNVLKEAVSGTLEFDLPAGLTTEPARPAFDPIPAGGSAQVVVHFASAAPKAGRHVVPYRVHYRPAGAEREVRCAALPVAVMVGPTLEFVYQHPRPAVYVLHAPKLTARFDMFHGLCRYLADDDDTVRLDGSPLFTLSDGKQEVLDEHTSHAFTWPTEAPARLQAQAQARCRWQVVPFGSSLLVRMGPGWTQFARTRFTVPGKWVSPHGPPRWKRIVGVKPDGNEYEARPGSKVKVAAAVLECPRGKWGLAFRFQPPREVTFKGTGLRFEVNSLTNEN